MLMGTSYLGILLTIIFGISGIIITLLVLNKPKLRYYQVFPGRLFSEEVNDISKLEIRYNKQKIEGELIFLQVLINNEGNCDIDSKDIYEPLAIMYNAPLVIVDAFINKNKENVNLEIKENSIYLKWDLLKKNEYFIVNVVLKYSVKNKLNINYRNLLRKYTTVKSRIKNIDNIKKESYLKIITNRDKLVFISLLSCMFILSLSMAFTTISINQKQREREILYNEINEHTQKTLEHIRKSIEFNQNVLNHNEKVREYLDEQGYALDKTIELFDYIFNHNNNININEINNRMNEVVKIMRNISRPEINFELLNEPIPLISTPTIDSDNFISINDIDGQVIFYFFGSLVVFMLDIYIIINYLRTRKISKYLKLV